MKAVRVTSLAALMVSVCLFLFFGTLAAAGSPRQENHCFSCHTNPRKLIQITREIARADQNKPGASIETEGEG